MSELVRNAQPKPAKGTWRRGLHERKQKRAQAKQRVKLAGARQRLALEAKRREAAYRRDKGRCRAFGIALWLHTENPDLIAHCHHMVYRSAGGSDEINNRITLSPAAHELEHLHRLRIKGDPNGTLYFAEYDKKQRLVRAWESTV